ncbi:unknown [Clostridium sp. CAG:1013]|nr:unknown [Clostridium sp. CAG:1013]
MTAAIFTPMSKFCICSMAAALVTLLTMLDSITMERRTSCNGCISVSRIKIRALYHSFQRSTK